MTICLAVAAISLAPMAALGKTKSHSSSVVLGDPLPGLTSEQRAVFNAGVIEFNAVETAADGLGPVFNAHSCAECHAQPIVGGSSPDLVVARETRFARIFHGAFDPMTNWGGPVLQRQSIHEELPDCSVEPEVVPAEATLVSLRATTPLFGAGLIEAIPKATILALADPNDRDGDGISGRPNIVFNPETGQNEIGRFGWKAHVSTLHLFAGDAYLNEMGVTSPSFPQENLPQGQPIPDGCDLIPETNGQVEDANGKDVAAFADFMRLLAPPSPKPQRWQVMRGKRIFVQIGCAKCHVPTLYTGDHPIEALRFKPVNLYSDLLLHNMGPELADGMEMGSAKGDEWRTTPLWGLSRRLFFLHDGRATNLVDAISAHGGEARPTRDRYDHLKYSERRALLKFLESL
jgi:CxxC motif-containing protein (DUF1111 family)